MGSPEIRMLLNLFGLVHGMQYVFAAVKLLPILSKLFLKAAKKLSNCLLESFLQNL